MRATAGKVLLWEASEAIQSVVPFERRLLADSPLVMMKVVKNDVEASGLREAHVKDGVALVRFFQWLEEKVDVDNVTEISAADKLREFRR